MDFRKVVYITETWFTESKLNLITLSSYALTRYLCWATSKGTRSFQWACRILIIFILFFLSTNLKVLNLLVFYMSIHWQYNKMLALQNLETCQAFIPAKRSHPRKTMSFLTIYIIKQNCYVLRKRLNKQDWFLS